MSSHVAASYLVQRSVFRITEFFRHWYVGGTDVFLQRLGAAMQSIEATVAFQTTLQHFFQPLFRDYSIVGRIIGPFFRIGRLAVGLVAYAILFVIFLAAYVVWLALPALLIVYAIRSAF
jgi:hypothetical protein